MTHTLTASLDKPGTRYVVHLYRAAHNAQGVNLHLWTVTVTADTVLDAARKAVLGKLQPRDGFVAYVTAAHLTGHLAVRYTDGRWQH